MVVGKARILYADSTGRKSIATFNDAIRNGDISGPIVLGRDHHDVSGTDSPYRETANIRDGSMFIGYTYNFVGDRSEEQLKLVSTMVEGWLGRGYQWGFRTIH